MKFYKKYTLMELELVLIHKFREFSSQAVKEVENGTALLIEG